MKFRKESKVSYEIFPFFGNQICNIHNEDKYILRTIKPPQICKHNIHLNKVFFMNSNVIEIKEGVLIKAKSLYRNNEFHKLISFCQKECTINPDNLEMWKLYSVAAGMLDKAVLANSCCLRIYDKNPDDLRNISNLIASYFHTNNPQKALEIIIKHSGDFEGEILESVLETITTATIEYDDVFNSIPNWMQDKILNR